ncbi:MAG: rhodanese-like domain-containing protein [Planctomycetota bacterium]
MKTTTIHAVGILIASSATGAAVNLVRPTSLPWIRPERVMTNPAVAQPTTTTETPLKIANAGSTARASEPTPAPPAATTMSAEDVLDHLKNGTARFVDAREPHEWVEGHFRGAIHIPASAIYANIDRVVREVPPHEKLIVYCGGGDCEASHHVADALTNDFKFQNVVIYTKGWQEVDSKKTEFAPYVATGAE